MTEEKKPKVSAETKRQRAEVKLLKECFDNSVGKAVLNQWIKDYIIDVIPPAELPHMQYFLEGQRFFVNKLLQTLNIDPSTIMAAADEESNPHEVD